MSDSRFPAPSAARLRATWANPIPGLRGWLCETHHTEIGKRFLVTALVFFALGGLEALFMRTQLMRPENNFLGPDLYDQLFTMHGSTMIFLFAVPVLQGLALYLVPLKIGARECAFPRLAAFSYWTYLLGGLLLYIAFVLNTGPDVGWFAYTPLSGPQFDPGKRADIWAQMITFTELSALAGAINMVGTILKHRAPGMSLDRMPLYCWSILVQSWMIIFAMPAIMLGSLMLATDRAVGTQFFNVVEGGDPLLWQHLFWFFGHPEVYIIFIPALGIMEALLVDFSRRQILGYPALVLSQIATAFLGFSVWVHHMFATGIPQLASGFYTAASLMIVVPTAVQFYLWIATIWSGRPRYEVPMLFALSWFVVFFIGGLTGVILASIPIDLQVHDTFFVVAHLHYVLIGGMVFPLMGGIYYWFPKMSGRMLDKRLGIVNFITFFVGFNLLFFPMHLLGLRGMPRRVWTYGLERGWGELNMLATVGAWILALSVIVFLINLLKSAWWGEVAGDDPWESPTLEWATMSPPPPYNFEELPTVTGHCPLWIRRKDQPVIRGLREDRREVLITRLLDAEPDHRSELPGPSAWPFWTTMAVGVLFIGAIFTPWAVPVGTVLTVLCAALWFWPVRPPRQELAPEQP